MTLASATTHPKPGRRRVGVLISGRGSNLQALIEACAAHDYPAQIVLVISNNPDAHGLVLAAQTGIPIKIVENWKFTTREGFDEALDKALRAARVELVCLAGFMRVLSPGFVTAWHDRLLNIHPSLLPEFPGLHTHQRAIEAGVRLHGCTVHFVRAAVDEGPIIVQAAVPVLPEDDADTLAARVLEAEHRCYPYALMLVAQGRVKVSQGRAAIDGAVPPEPLRLAMPESDAAG